MEREKLNLVRICIGLGGAPNNAICEISYSDAEASMESIMAKRREDAINNAQKLWEEMKLVFSPELRTAGAVPSAAPAPQAPAGPVGGSNPTCIHGARVFKQGNGSKGPWQAWMCPTKQGTPDQCKPDWITKK